MMCYRDRTFCTFYEGCSDGNDCPVAMTPEVQIAANHWWGKPGAPIALYLEKPQCFTKMAFAPKGARYDKSA